MIPYGRQSISDEDINFVKSILESDFITQGPIVPKFENKIASITNSRHCIAANSATSCLHLGCLSLGISKGDIVWTSPISFVASSNAALYCGAKVDFVDIDDNTFNICIKKLEQKLNDAKASGSLPKLLIVVHMCGNPAEMEEIKKLSIKYNFKIMEDASHSIGSSIGNNKTGSCEFSDLCVFSFHPVKIITTGEGGVITTNDSMLANKIKSLRSHGITREEKDFLNHNDGGWYYEQHSLGFNYRMTDIQAALGYSQLKRLDQFIKKRNLIAKNYLNSLDNLPLNFQKVKSNFLSSYHLFVIQIKHADSSKLRKELYDWLKSDGIGANVHYIPIHFHPYYANIGFKRGSFPSSEKYYESSLSIPLYPDLSESNQQKVIESIKSFFK